MKLILNVCHDQVHDIADSPVRSTSNILGGTTNIGCDNDVFIKTTRLGIIPDNAITRQQKVKLAQNLLDVFGGILNM